MLLKSLLYFLFSFFITHAGAFAVEIAPSFVILGNKLKGRRLPVVTSQLNSSDKIQKIVIVLHGIKRDAVDYFRMISQAAPPGSLNETLILAPQFLNQKDMRTSSKELAPETLFWRKSSWKDGQSAYDEPTDDPTTSSFTVMDELLLLLKSLYPNIKNIVFASHSAGSQFLQRYAALTQIDSNEAMRNVHLRFLVSDPSTYLYFDDHRPVANGNFKLVDLNTCPDANNYHYGLDNIVAYGAGQSAPEIRKRYLARDIRYLLGTKDNDPNDPSMDKRCGAMAQGQNRLERGLNYINYLQGFGKKSLVYLIEGADHDGAHFAAKIYHSPEGKELVYGN